VNRDRVCVCVVLRAELTQLTLKLNLMDPDYLFPSAAWAPTTSRSSEFLI